jgi:hypothetical protein
MAGAADVDWEKSWVGTGSDSDSAVEEVSDVDLDADGRKEREELHNIKKMSKGDAI